MGTLGLGRGSRPELRKRASHQALLGWPFSFPARDGGLCQAKAGSELLLAFVEVAAKSDDVVFCEHDGIL